MKVANIWRQCEFLDNEGAKHYGLINPDTHEIICSCCGGTFDGNDARDVAKYCIYHNWIDFGDIFRD